MPISKLLLTFLINDTGITVRFAGLEAGVSKIELTTIDAMDEGVASIMMRQSPECVKILDPTGELRFMNENGMTLMEIEDFKLVEGQLWWDLWPKSLKTVLQDAVLIANRGMGAMFEAPCPTAKGTLKHWRVRVMAIRGEKMRGKIMASSLDISSEVATRAG